MAITQNNLKADVKADLYGLFLAGFTAELMGENSVGDQPIRWYDAVSSSTATDDGENVLLPTGFTGPGRWIKRTTEQLSSDWNATTGPTKILNKPTIGTAKRQEKFLGSTDASGNYTITYSPAYSVTPDIQPVLQGGSNTQIIKITSTTASGFTVNVQNRTDTLGLLPSYSAVSGASVGVLVTERQ